MSYAPDAGGIEIGACPLDRRSFLMAAAGGALGLLPFHRLSAKQKGKVRITNVKCMIVRGTWDWNIIKVETDSGLYGLGEAYWGWGVKDLVVNKLCPIVVGEDPLNVDKLYTKMLMESAGAGAIAGVTVTAASGIEIALWDLAGRILETPACNLLGGRFRDRIRFYRTVPAAEWHRDRALGPRGAHPRDAGVHPAGGKVSRPHPVLPNHARGRPAGGPAGVARPSARSQGRKIRRDRLQVPG